jgi:hypothetical protein
VLFGLGCAFACDTTSTADGDRLSGNASTGSSASSGGAPGTGAGGSDADAGGMPAGSTGTSTSASTTSGMTGVTGAGGASSGGAGGAGAEDGSGGNPMGSTGTGGGDGMGGAMPGAEGVRCGDERCDPETEVCVAGVLVDQGVSCAPRGDPGCSGGCLVAGCDGEEDCALGESCLYSLGENQYLSCSMVTGYGALCSDASDCPEAFPACNDIYLDEALLELLGWQPRACAL